MLTNTREINGSTSSFVAYNVLQDIGALPHNVLRLRVAFFDIFQPLLPKSFNRCPRSSVHLDRPVVSVTEQLLHVLVQASRVPNSS